MEVVATYITATTNATTTNGSAVYVGLVTGYTSTSAPFDTTTEVGTTLAETLDATLTTSTSAPFNSTTAVAETLDASTLAATTIQTSTTASQPNNKTSDNRIFNDKFISDDLSNEFLEQKSDSTVLAINLLLTVCAVMVATTI